MTTLLLPYMADTMKSSDALMVATAHMKDFMMNQTRQQDVQFFSRFLGRVR